MEWLARSPGSEQGSLAPRRRRAALALTLVSGAVLGAVGLLALLPRPNPARVVRVTIAPPEGKAITPGPFLTNIAISPDGSKLVISMTDGPQNSSLWVRPIGSEEMQRLAGTEGALMPFWSADSQGIGCFAAGKLKIISAAGGMPVTLADTANLEGGAWNQEGTILFAATPAQGSRHTIYRVSSKGGQRQPGPEADSEENCLAPSFLPTAGDSFFGSPAPIRPRWASGSLRWTNLVEPWC